MLSCVSKSRRFDHEYVEQDNHVSSRAAQTARDLPIADCVTRDSSTATCFGRVRTTRKRFRVVRSRHVDVVWYDLCNSRAIVGSLGALRQPRDDNACYCPHTKGTMSVP